MSSMSLARIQSGVYPDKWAEALSLKVDGHNWDIRGREYQIGIMRDESEWIVIPKGAQVGLTTAFLVRSFNWVVKRKWHHLYLMPLKTGAIPFVQGRIDPIINSNDELAHIFKSVDNRLHKQSIDDIAFRIRGTNIWTELREIPSDVLVMDERDKMVEENIPEAEARLDGSLIHRVVELSTPTAPGIGVDADDAWKMSDQHRWFVPCPHCGRRQNFTVDENVVIGEVAEECFLRCAFCKKAISDADRALANAFGSWEADNPNGTKRGYHISQLNSPTKSIEGFMKNYFDGLRDVKKMRAWYNNNRGEPYVAHGDKITAEMLDACIGKGYYGGGMAIGPAYIGVDVGSVLHCRVNYLSKDDRAMAWKFIIFSDKPGKDMWMQLDEFLSNLNSFTCVIDAHPEKTQAKRLALKYHKRVWIGFEFDRPDQAETALFNVPGTGAVGKVSIDRTCAFDASRDRIMHGRLVLPVDARLQGENMPNLEFNGYYHQMTQQVRVEEEDTRGRFVARWRKNKNPDHWHHAEMFCETAMMKKPYTVLSQSAGELFARTGNVISSGA
jgi:hypothetical protein